MSDTSVVFNVLARENVSGPLGRVRALFRSAGQEASRATRGARVDTERLDKQIHEVQHSLAALNAEFAATGNKELFAKMKRDRSLLSQLQSVRREVGSANDEVDRFGSNDRAGSMLSRLGQAAQTAGSNLQSTVMSAMSAVAGNAWLLVGAAGAAAAAIAAISPAAFLAGGALGSLPGIMAGVASAFGALKLGTMGLSEAWKSQTTSSGGAARAAQDMTAKHRAVEQAAKGVERAERAVQDAIKNVTRAERDVADAQKAAAAATREVASAIAEEQRRRRDLATDLASANLDVEDAVANVTQAESELNAARANGEGPDKVAELERAYERAQIAVEEAKNRVSDLSDEQTEADKTTVEGSAAVVAARDRVTEAEQRVADAQDAQREAVQRVTDAREAQKDAVQQLADAQKALNTSASGGGGGGGPVTPKIAASAQKFLDVLKSLRPAFERLRLGVQERLFSGLGDKLQMMATAWLPTATTSLNNMATTFNGIAKTFMSSASQPTFIANMATASEAVRGALEKVGLVVAGPLTTAFGNLAGASKPFIDALGGEVARLLSDFSAKVNKLAEGGENSKLNRFFRTAADVLHDVFHVLRDVKDIIGGVLSAIFGQPESGLGPWKSFVVTMDKIAAWFRDPQNQQRIRDFITKLEEWGGKMKSFFESIAPAIGPAMSAIGFALVASANAIRFTTDSVKVFIDRVQWLWKNAPKAWDAVKKAFGSAKDWIVSKVDSLVDKVGGLKSRITKKAAGMWDGVKTAFKNTINWLIAKWNGLQFTIGGGSFMGMSVPSATFGTPDIPYLAKGGTATRGGMAVVGDAGPELLAMPQGASVIPLDHGGGGPMQLVVSAGSSSTPAMQALVRALLPHLQYEVRTAGRGSAQQLLGAKG